MSLKEINVKISADSSNFRKGVSEAEKALQSAFKKDYLSDLNKQLMSTSETISGLIGKAQAFTAVLAGGFGFVALVKGTTESAASIKRLADAYGMTVKEAARFKTAVSNSGGDVEGTIKQLAKLQYNVDSMSKSTESTRQMLDLLGVSFRDTNGNLLPYEERLSRLADGYKKAREAGEGELFIMETLGAKGATLIPVLERFEKERDLLSKRESAGLDIVRAAELDEQIRLLEMQAGQLKTAFSEAFIPIAEQIVPKVLNELQYLTEVFRENKERIAEITEAITKMIAAYAAFKTAKAVQGALNGAVSSASQMLGLSKSAAQLAEEEAIKQKQLASDQKFIAQREKLLQDSANRQMKIEYNKLQKQLQDGRITEAEFARLYAQRTTKIQQECIRQQQIVRETLQQEINLARNAAGQVAQSEQQKANAAKSASTQIQAANGTAAQSAQKIVQANQVAGNSSQTMANRMTTAVGNAGRFIGSNFLPIIGLIGTTWLMSGTDSLTATGKMSEGCLNAIKPVDLLTSAVMALATGWWQAALAFAAFAGIKAMGDRIDFQKEHTLEMNGKKYIKEDKDGPWKEIVPDTSSNPADSVNNVTQYYGKPVTEKRVAVSMEMSDMLDSQFRFKNPNSLETKLFKAKNAEIKAEKTAENLEEEANRRLANLGDDIKAVAGGGGDSTGGGNSKAIEEANKIITKTVKISLDRLVNDTAYRYNDWLGKQWTPWEYGITDRTKYTGDLSKQCDSWTADFYATLFKTIGKENPFKGVVNEEDFQALGAFDTSPNAIGEIGDLVGGYKDGNYHYGVIIGPNTVRSRDSNGGLTDRTVDDWKDRFGFIGYGKLRKVLGGDISIEKVLTGTKEQIEAQEKGLKIQEELLKAQEDMAKLTGELKSEYLSINATEWQKNQLQLYNDLREKQDRINEAKGKGADITEAQLALDTLRIKKQEDLEKQYKKNIEKAQSQMKISQSELNFDFKQQALEKYYQALREAEEKRIETIKQIGKTQDDVTANAIANAQKEIDKKKARLELDKSLLSATSQRLDKLAEEGRLLQIMAEEESSAFDLVTESVHRGNVKLSQMYVEMLKSVHLSATEMMANTVESLSSSMSSGLAEFIQGTKSAGDAFREMGQSILKTMSEIIAKAIVMKALAPILGGLFKGNPWSYSDGTRLDSTFGWTGNVVTGFTNGYDFTNPFKMAEGGIVTAPTMAMIGEAGDNEAVIPLTDKNLAMLGGGGKAPSVRVNITNNTGDEAKATENDVSWDEQMQEYVVNVVLDRTERNVGGFRTSMKGLLNS